MSVAVTFDAYPVGALLGPVYLDITAEMASRYAQAVDSKCLWYTEASPFGGPVVPYTAIEQVMLITLGTVYHVTDAPGGTVQYRLDISYQKPVPIGTRVTIQGRTCDTMTRPGRYQSSFAFEVFTEDGVPAIDGTVTQAHLLSGASARQSAAAQGAASPTASACTQCTGDFGTLAPGVVLPALQIPMTIEAMRLYAAWPKLAAFGREIENQHTNEIEARRLGRPGVIAMGAHLVGYLEEYLLRCFGAAWLCAGRLTVTFIGMVLAGDTLEIASTVRTRTVAGDSDRVGLDVVCRTARGTTAIAGTAEVKLPIAHMA